MKYKRLNLITLTLIILTFTGCLSLSDPTATSSVQKTYAYGYFTIAGTVGCYGDSADTTVKYLTTQYTLAMVDNDTMSVCVTVQTQSDTTISASVLTGKTINFYATNTAPTAAGTYMDATAVPIPAADGSAGFYILGTSTPCPDGSTAKLVGYLNMASFKIYKYVEIYDSCAGQLVGYAMSPLEAQRQIGGN